MKKTILSTFFLFITILSFSQDLEKKKTKMDEFSSVTGEIIKFKDYNLPNLKLNFGAATTKIREFVKGSEKSYFYLITLYSQGNITRKTSIAYDDLLETIKAIETLKEESLIDVSNDADYLEAKFLNEDSFSVGYYVNKGKAYWYFVSEKYVTDYSLSIRNYETLIEAFKGAKDKIESLMKG